MRQEGARSFGLGWAEPPEVGGYGCEDRMGRAGQVSAEWHGDKMMPKGYRTLLRVETTRAPQKYLRLQFRLPENGRVPSFWLRVSGGSTLMKGELRKRFFPYVPENETIGKGV